MRKTSCLFAAVMGLLLQAEAQRPEDKTRSTGFPVFPVITNAAIPGAPMLGQPVLITGTQQEIRTEKHGLVYPLLYDWNKDGKPDLLLGEFETGQTGSDIKVYLNEGSAKKPRFSGKYVYAKDIQGDTMTTHQWCCIGTHPRLADLNNDGIPDLLSGQYNPGKINWWPGAKAGFASRRFVDQEGYAEGARLQTNADQLSPDALMYWNYSSAGFADMNGDGLVDMVVGGASISELRVALNTGTADQPKFGLRKNLLGIDGLPLSVVKPSAKETAAASRSFKMPHYAGVQKTFMTPVDWDADGVIDLLVTHLYGDVSTKDPVVFFRGVQTDKGLRFEEARPLFTAEQARKTFPGCQPNITVADYNGDGVMDLIIGISLPTVNGFNIDTAVAWSYLHDLGIEAPGKDAGRAIEWEGSMEKIIQKVEANEGMRRYYLGKLTDYKYLTLRHRGYVYVMYGKKNPVKATPVKGVLAKEEVRVRNEVVKADAGEGPVRFAVKGPGAVRFNDTGRIEVRFSFDEGWYGYAATPANIAAGWIPTQVEYVLPAGFEKTGDPVLPPSVPKGGAEVYKGGEVVFYQGFRYTGMDSEGRAEKPGQKALRVTVHYQTCDEEKCLPPETAEVDLKVNTGY
ncbi:MAG: FG-GAP-like repeat-containing protein [Candidatus Pseudobacter hemicellulosilyticus]|uniref:FG-GAP-like repeat-containing protein n=1 Tax=Candidatus Pseudobacter hemicellulosilyticus TaxID=3121375 RepID=A0AAJ5WPA5_9BACT|nr:MAG: FG-GAP-like repeat-containing protein [Pseudobacter sp.]